MGEVVDDAEQADQAPIRRPPSVALTDTLDLALDGATQVAQPTQQQLDLVRRTAGELWLLS
jgi:hypothetical protein